jgi:hypothetical protein
MPRTRSAHTNGRLTFADILHNLGDIDPRRVLADPFSGKATEADLLRIQTHEDRHCELVDGVLVEKAMGYPESCLTGDLVRLIGNHVAEHDLGYLVLPDGATRLWEGLVRMPDFHSFRGVSCRESSFPRRPLPPSSRTWPSRC